MRQKKPPSRLAGVSCNALKLKETRAPKSDEHVGFFKTQTLDVSLLVKHSCYTNCSVQELAAGKPNITSLSTSCITSSISHYPIS